MKTTESGGSSSDLRSAFQASLVIWCASSRMYNFRAGIGGSSVGVEDPTELALDLRDRQAADVVALKPGEDRRRELLGVGRGEHEDDRVGRLLERLEERVPGVLRDLVRLVEDVHLPSWDRRLVRRRRGSDRACPRSP